MKTVSFRMRCMAAVLCAVMIVFSLISGIYIIHASGHFCTSDECPVCAGVRLCADNLKLFRMSSSASCAMLPRVFIFIIVMHRTAEADAEASPVARKVRLNN